MYFYFCNIYNSSVILFASTDMDSAVEIHKPKRYDELTKEERHIKNNSRMFFGSGMKRNVSSKMKTATCANTDTLSQTQPIISKYLTTEEKMNKLEKFLEEEKQTNHQAKWKSLNKTDKHEKLQQFALEFGSENQLNEQELSDLKIYLKHLLDTDKLKQIKDVVFNKETRCIDAIPGLTFVKATGRFSLKNLEKRNNEAVLKAIETLELNQQQQQQIHNQTVRHLGGSLLTTSSSATLVVATKKERKRKKQAQALEIPCTSDI